MHHARWSDRPRSREQQRRSRIRRRDGSRAGIPSPCQPPRRGPHACPRRQTPGRGRWRPIVPGPPPGGCRSGPCRLWHLVRWLLVVPWPRPRDGQAAGRPRQAAAAMEQQRWSHHPVGHPPPARAFAPAWPTHRLHPATPAAAHPSSSRPPPGDRPNLLHPPSRLPPPVRRRSSPAVAGLGRRLAARSGSSMPAFLPASLPPWTRSPFPSFLPGAMPTSRTLPDDG